MTYLASPPVGERDRAHWLLSRHPYLASLVGRLTETRVVNESDPYWPGALATIVTELERSNAAWADYVDTHPEPAWDASEDEVEAWQQAGPSLPGAVRPLAAMSGSEVRLIRTLATLGGAVRWEAADLWALERCPDDPACPGLADDILAVMRVHV